MQMRWGWARLHSVSQYAFNSLFEMPYAMAAATPYTAADMLSILYLRCMPEVQLVPHESFIIFQFSI